MPSSKGLSFAMATAFALASSWLSRRFGSRNHVLVVAILFQIAVQTVCADSQYLRRPQTIPLAHCQHSLDGYA